MKGGGESVQRKAPPIQSSVGSRVGAEENKRERKGKIDLF